jgi:hypothetical protein
MPCGRLNDLVSELTSKVVQTESLQSVHGASAQETAHCTPSAQRLASELFYWIKDEKRATNRECATQSLQLALRNTSFQLSQNPRSARPLTHLENSPSANHQLRIW